MRDYKWPYEWYNLLQSTCHFAGMVIGYAMSDYQFVEGAPMTEAMIRIFGDALQDFMFVFVGGTCIYMYVWRGFYVA